MKDVSGLKGVLLCGTAFSFCIACITPAVAFAAEPASPGEADTAQTAPDKDKSAAEPAADGAPAPEIIVTGTRLNNGMNSPTPVTMLSSEQLTATAPNNVADSLARLPAFGAGVSTQAPVSTGTTGTVGQNLLNLRGLGENRNLVLLDGRRVVSSNQAFAVDINTIPQNIIKRVDVVTGGASAAYGSDAVAGVVNFVLDTDFKGLKGEASGGISTYGDVPSYQGNLAYGGDFLDGRLHVLASQEYFKSTGEYHSYDNPRGWFNDLPALIPNTLSSTPTNLVVKDARSSLGTTGGLISSGPLKGTQFLEDGVPAPFDYGYNSGPVFQSGGDGEPISYGFTPYQERINSFMHASLDLTDNVSLFGEFGYAYSKTSSSLGFQILTGSRYSFNIYNDNPFLPESIVDAMAANDLTSFRMGRYMGDFGEALLINRTNVYREVFGLQGTDLFDMPGWDWEISYSGGQAKQYYAETNLSNLRNLYAAADAVVNPQTGQIVCRSTYYTPDGVFVPGGTGIDADCVPVNVIGKDVANQNAIDWINGTSSKVLKTTMHVIEAKLSGDTGSFALPGGPISFAVGGDIRWDKATQTSDAASQEIVDATGLRAAPSSINGKLGVWRFGNFQPFSGKQTVKEGFLELGLPILADMPWARALTANLAGRYTSYSLAGDVQTWKVGLDYAPSSSIRFRGTVSRDIRAPNLLELFNTAIQNTNNVLYPSSTDGTTHQAVITISGNPNLKPEKALTQTYGVVLTPQSIPRLSLSVDYFKIKMDGAIDTTSQQNIVDFCARGLPGYCDLISFNPTTNIVNVLAGPVNLAELQVSGLDIEAGYTFDLFENPMSIRMLANHSISNFSEAPDAPRQEVKGSATSPQWKAQLQLNYRAPDWSVFLNERFISAVMMDPNQEEGVYTDDNHVNPIFYTDLTLTKDFDVGNGEIQGFVTVENLFNQDPPVDVVVPTSLTNITSPIYDRIGRYFTAGIRFTF